MNINDIIDIHIKLRKKHNLVDVAYFRNKNFTIEDYEKSFDIKKNKEKRKKKESYLTIIINIFNIPMLILHELFHFITALLINIKVYGFKISSPLKNNFYGSVLSLLNKNYIKNIIVSTSPIMIVIISFILPFINFNFIYFSFYVLLTIKVALPSKEDMITVLILLKIKNKLPLEEVSLLINVTQKNSRYINLYK